MIRHKGQGGKTNCNRRVEKKSMQVALKLGIVATLALGLPPRQGLTKVRAENEAQESHFALPGM